MRTSVLAGILLFVFVCRAQNSVTVATDHFLLTADRNLPRADIAWMMETLEQAHDRLAREWRIVFPRKVPVYLHATTREFTAATGMPGYMKGATVDRTIHLQAPSILKRYTPLAIIIHELVHAYVAAPGSSPVPRWFAEGSAIYISGSPEILPVPSSPLPAFDRLDTALDTHQYRRQRQAYSDAREYIQRLVRIGGKESLARFLKELQRNSFEHCLDTVFRLSIPDIEHSAGR